MTNPNTAMTCQCCGRKYQAKLGTIAHHGYERPGEGWQTASCIGAKHLPYEASRDQIKIMIDLMKTRLKQMRTDHDLVQNDAKAITKITTKRQMNAWAPKEYITVEVTRDTFDAQQAQLRKDFSFYGDFEQLKKIDLDKRAKQINGMRGGIAEQTRRYNEWIKTHKYDAATKQWLPI